MKTTISNHIASIAQEVSRIIETSDETAVLNNLFNLMDKEYKTRNIEKLVAYEIYFSDIIKNTQDEKIKSIMTTMSIELDMYIDGHFSEDEMSEFDELNGLFL